MKKKRKKKDRQQRGPAGSRTSARVLHISDLHFGRGFQHSNWTKLIDVAMRLRPDLVIVTGDLVNTPWHWSLSRARSELEKLISAIKGSNSDARLCVVPGNHDTRITGLLPVRWLLWISLAAVFALKFLESNYPCFWEGGYGLFISSTSIVLALLGLAAIVLRLCVRMDLGKVFGEFFLTKATALSNIPIGVIPFDSASQDVSWARGRISEASFAAFPSDLRELADGRDIVWIAAVHHHPLPLPYDDSAEKMMAMDNAGMFLKELSKRQVPLVLHGHKHHQHFATMKIDPREGRQTEIAVLSAGSPTHGRGPFAFAHGFNVLDVDERRIRVSMYEASQAGGMFECRHTFDIASLEEQDRRRHEQDRHAIGVHCKRMLCIADIGPYGDASVTREFRSVSTDRRSLQVLTGPYSARVERGMVEAFRAKSISIDGPSVSLQVSGTRTRNHIEAHISFGDPGLQSKDRPIDFVTEFYGNNAFALNRWQYECMYPGVNERNESITFDVPQGIAVTELLIHVVFPLTSSMPRRISTKQRLPSAAPSDWSDLSEDCLIRMESQRSIQVRIMFPVPNSKIQVNWDLVDDAVPVAGSLEERDVGRARALRDTLNKVIGAPVPLLMSDLVAKLQSTARRELGVESQKPYDIALFAFNAIDKCLRYVIGTHDPTDLRTTGCYPFGLGLVGRSFKSGKTVGFRKPVFGPDEQAWGYLLPDGVRVASAQDVKEYVVLCIPLAPPNAPDWPYGVLQLSSDDPNCILKTENTESDNSVQRFREAVSDLTSDFESILSYPGHQAR